MHFLARTTFSLPFFLSARAWLPSADANPTPSRSVQIVPSLPPRHMPALQSAEGPRPTSLSVTPPLTSRSVLIPPRTEDVDLTESSFTDTKHLNQSRASGAQVFFHSPGAPAAKKSTDDTATSGQPTEASWDSPFKRTFLDKEKFLELTLDENGALQAGAGADKTLPKADPETVRSYLRDEFEAELILRWSGVTQEGVDAHWNAALGTHSKAGTMSRPVLVHHLNLLTAYIHRLSTGGQ